MNCESTNVLWVDTSQLADVVDGSRQWLVAWVDKVRVTNDHEVLPTPLFVGTVDSQFISVCINNRWCVMYDNSPTPLFESQCKEKAENIAQLLQQAYETGIKKGAANLTS